MTRRLEREFTVRLFGRAFLGFSRVMTVHASASSENAQPAVPVGLPAGQTAEGPVYVVDSMLLHECHDCLTRTQYESLHAVTGVVLGRQMVLERIVPLELSAQSVVGAEAENGSLADALICLNGYGLLPLAYFHSHPGRGASATEPSGTDRRTQEMMEKSGSRIIGGIFSRDGFVRFYANGWEPEMHVEGKRAREVKRNVYRLELDKEI